MARVDILKRLYSRDMNSFDFKFDMLAHPGILNYLSIQDIMELNKIASSNRLADDPKQKYFLLDSIMQKRGFKRLASGTNRVVYKCLEDQSFVLKVALDKVGLSDSLNEYKNQWYLKPYVTKCFDVTPDGTVGMFERVEPITSRIEFASIAEDYYDMIVNNIIGKYILDDIGSNYFMNCGVRSGFGVVLLDYPYLFELDDKKLYCNLPDVMDPSRPCDGVIDYDIGFNTLVCSKCGKRYAAHDLKRESDKQNIIVRGESTMELMIVKGKGKNRQVVKTISRPNSTSNFIPQPSSVKKSIEVSVAKSSEIEENSNKVFVDIRESLRPEVSTLSVEVVKKNENTPVEKATVSSVYGEMKAKELATGVVGKATSKIDEEVKADPKSLSKNDNVSVEDSPEIEELYQKTTPKKATTKKATAAKKPAVKKATTKKVVKEEEPVEEVNVEDIKEADTFEIEPRAEKEDPNCPDFEIIPRKKKTTSKKSTKASEVESEY